MLIAVMACGSSSRGRISPTAEFHAGDSIAVQQPVMKVNSSSVAGPPQPANISAASTTTLTACTASAARIRRPRSVVSASTPAGSASTNIGRNTAVCTSAARKLEPVSSTISQLAAMPCMALATKYTALAIHRLRKLRCRSVARMDGVGAGALGAGVDIVWPIVCAQRNPQQPQRRAA
jgi:hypothetical protein